MDCFDLTDTDFSSTAQMWKYLVSGKPIGCFRMAARYAPVAFAEIRAALSAEHADGPAAPVSCSAVVARRLGASELHATTVTGLAGGIGLSGGACGALGAAVWLDAMNGERDYKALEARATRIVERFLEASGHRFECSEIVGHGFADVAEHAAHSAAENARGSSRRSPPATRVGP